MLEKWFEPVDSSWKEFLTSQEKLLININQAVYSDKNSNVLPAPNQVLRCLSIPLSDVRCLIVGQDPYPDSAHACGLAFAVDEPNKPLPMSLRNIRKELLSDCTCQEYGIFDIAKWQGQGVMLLNQVLTVNEKSSNSHSKIGWQKFTRALVEYLDAHQQICALLMGSSAQKLGEVLKHANIVTTVHPSPLSAHRGFFGSKPFSRINEYLEDSGQEKIDWCIAFSTHK